ncbi:MAG: glycosyltransferase [bacterium]
MNYSVVIPTYNASEFIFQTIDSVINQTEKDFEIVVVDDGSTDQTIDIIESFKNPKIKIHRLEHTGNIGRNLNLGIKNSKYDLICILGADDVWIKNKIEVQSELLHEYNFICTNGSIINGNNKIIRDRYVKDFETDRDISLCDLLENNYIIASSMIGQKKDFVKYGGFDELDGTKAEDYILWLKITEKEKIKFINRNLMQYRIHNKNLSFRNSESRISLLMKTYNIRNDYLKNSNSEEVKLSALSGIIPLLNELFGIYLRDKMLFKAKIIVKKRIELQKNKLSFDYIKWLLKLALVNYKYCIRRIHS